MSPPSKSSSALSITLTQASKVRLVSSFLSLFVLLALFHAAEIAITTLYPWKVREFAEEEGGMWLSLDADITRVLTTILVSSTTAGIYATTVFGKLAAASGPTLERYAAPALTLLTLFFVELLPKSIGVSNAEMVARKLVPPINFLAHIVSPVGVCLTGLAKRVLRIFGFSVGGMELVTEEELRLIVSGARDSGSIESTEGDMIQAVLDLQDQKVEEIMKPRVEIVAVEGSMSVANVLGVIRESGYSRIPVYEGEIDNVVGVVLAKDLIDFFVGGLQVRDDRLEKIKNDKAAYDNVKDEDGDVDGDDAVAIPSTNIDQPTTAVPDPRTGPTSSYHSELSNASPGGPQPTPTPAFGFGGGYGAASVEVVERALTGAEVASRMSTGIEDAGLVQDVYFVPESMLVWNVLQEMKKRRVHLAIVVDEYGGTEGLVSLEDIIEEVVGEIYDEDDEEEVMRIAEEGGMVRREDGKYNVRGDAELEIVVEELGLEVAEDILREFGTISGFLVYSAGEIPVRGDVIMIGKWQFNVAGADERRILEVEIEPLVGGVDDEDREEDGGTRGVSRGALEGNGGGNGNGNAAGGEGGGRGDESGEGEEFEWEREGEDMVDVTEEGDIVQEIDKIVEGCEEKIGWVGGERA